MIGISLLTLVPRISGGSETYARELVRALARVGRLEYHVFAPTLAPDAIDGLPGTTVSTYPASRSTLGRVAAMGAATAFPARIRRDFAIETLGALHFPLTIAIPRGTQIPTATSVLDLQHEFFPRFFSRAELAYRRVAYRAAVQGSDVVITISQHVKETIVERLGMKPDRVRVIYPGVDLERLHPSDAERETFLLYPANGWPHKNHARLLEAFAILRRDRPELRLVLTGSGLEALPPAAGVEVRGHVPRDELIRLYRTAAALVFPSLYEGFGLPPLEAMACGCPVAAARAGALPEICGDAARYFDPTRPDEIASTVLDVLARAGDIAKGGLARARTFTWDECARRHDDVYEHLASLD
jgi:glycosyltransferase involved in cell wall biosynthesis